MITRKQLIRLVILIAGILAIFLIGRELYYARSYVQMINPVSVSFDEMVQKAEVIARGTVTKKLSSYRTIEDGEVMVYTRWKFDVEKAYKGDPGKTIKLKTLGGRYGLTEVRVEGTAIVTLGKPMILFLSRQNGDYVIQFSQDYYAVERDAQGQEILVQQLSKETMTFDELSDALE